jgi:hypothetical protein
LKEGFIQPTFRVRKEANKLFAYLKFKGVNEGITKEHIHELITKYSLDFLEKNQSKVIFHPYEPRRKVTGYSLTPSTLEQFYEYHKAHKKKYQVAELAELVLYIYAIKHLNPEEILLLDLNEWGINIIEN